MNKQMLNMDDLDQENGGNIFTDAWDWICDKLSRDDKPKPDQKRLT